MDVARLRRGELIAGVSGVALFIIMFLSWFGAPENAATEFAEAAGVDTTANAWQSFDLIDLILLLTVIVSVGLAVATAAARTVALPVAASAITAGLGILATILVLYRLIDPPEDAGREFGVWLGLIASAGVALGGWLSMQEEGTTFGAAAEQARDRFGGRGGPPSPPPPGGTTRTPPPGGTTEAPGGTGGTAPPSGPPPSAPPPSREQ
jgi:hypothetical protein